MPGLTDGAPVLFEDIMKSGSDYWFSVSELMVSDLRVAASKCRQNDWLAGARILSKHVELVMPYDGAVLHTEKGYDVVSSRLPVEIYLFNWILRMWLHNPDTKNITDYRKLRPGDKRIRAADDDDDEGNQSDDNNDLYEEPQPRRRRAQTFDFSAITSMQTVPWSA